MAIILLAVIVFLAIQSSSSGASSSPRKSQSVSESPLGSPSGPSISHSDTLYYPQQGSPSAPGQTFFSTPGGQLIAASIARRLAPRNSGVAIAADIGAGLAIAKPGVELGKEIAGLSRPSSSTLTRSDLTLVNQPAETTYYQTPSETTYYDATNALLPATSPAVDIPFVNDFNFSSPAPAVDVPFIDFEPIE